MKVYKNVPGRRETVYKEFPRGHGGHMCDNMSDQPLAVITFQRSRMDKLQKNDDERSVSFIIGIQ